MPHKMTIMMATMAATGAGYLAGMLLAPKSGQDMRQQVRGKAKIAADKIQGRITQSKHKMNEAADTASSKLDEMKDIARKNGMSPEIKTHPAM